MSGTGDPHGETATAQENSKTDRDPPPKEPTRLQGAASPSGARRGRQPIGNFRCAVRSSGGLPPRSWKSSDRDDKPRSWLANQYDVDVPEGGRPRVLRRSIVFFDDVLKAGVGSFDRYFRYPVT